MGGFVVRVRPAPPPTNARLPVLVLKLLKMATGMRALLDTVVQALPQVRRPLWGLAWVWLPCSQGTVCLAPSEPWADALAAPLAETSKAAVLPSVINSIWKCESSKTVLTRQNPGFGGSGYTAEQAPW